MNAFSQKEIFNKCFGMPVESISIQIAAIDYFVPTFSLKFDAKDFVYVASHYFFANDSL